MAEKMRLKISKPCACNVTNEKVPLSQRKCAMNQKSNQRANLPANIDEIIKLVLKSAVKAREDAGYGGRHDDGGARHIEEQVKFFNYGLARQMPPEWQDFANQFDSEYSEYQRLKKKFEK
jgi:hypothetical protein